VEGRGEDDPRPSLQSSLYTRGCPRWSSTAYPGPYPPFTSHARRPLLRSCWLAAPEGEREKGDKEGVGCEGEERIRHDLREEERIRHRIEEGIVESITFDLREGVRLRNRHRSETMGRRARPFPEPQAENATWNQPRSPSEVLGTAPEPHPGEHGLLDRRCQVCLQLRHGVGGPVSSKEAREVQNFAPLR